MTASFPPSSNPPLIEYLLVSSMHDKAKVCKSERTLIFFFVGCC
jgi:hypothetical protein